MINHEAIYALYQNVVSIDDEAGAFDAEGNSVEIDEKAVKEKTAEMKKEAQQAKDAQEAARQSALNKLMALGLTEEEALALGVK